MEDCIFCKIVSGKASAHKFWEDGAHIAFLSIFPNTEGFSVVATKKHLPSYAFENSDEVLSDLIIATKNVARIIDTTFEDVGRTGMFFEGFGVDHLHSKLFPMHGTGDLKEWKMIESGKNKSYFEKYPGFLSSNDSERADDTKLAELSLRLRKVAEKLKI